MTRFQRQPSRREALIGLGATAAGLTLPLSAFAQAYPDKPVRMIVPFGPGTTTDIISRVVGDGMSRELGQPLVVENRAGAGGSVGSQQVARGAADGYQIVMGTVGTHAINASLYKKLPYDPIKDFAPLTRVAMVPNLLVAHPSQPFKTVQEMIAYAKANPGKINYGSAGSGTPQNISCELFKMMTGVNLVHVPYRGGAPSTSDLVGGHLHVIFSPVSESIEHVRAGKLRALAVTTAKRLDVLPDVPTVGDFVPGYEASGFAGIGAPRGTPPEIIDLLNRELNAGLADPKVSARIVDLGGTIAGGTPAAFGAVLQEATEKWAKVIQFAGIKVD